MKIRTIEKDPIPPQAVPEPALDLPEGKFAPLRKGDRVRAVSRDWEGVLLDSRPRTDGCFLVMLGGGEYWWAGRDLERIGCGYCGGTGLVSRIFAEAGTSITRSCPACGG